MIDTKSVLHKLGDEFAVDSYTNNQYYFFLRDSF